MKSLRLNTEVKLSDADIAVVQLLGDDNTVEDVANAIEINKRTLEARILLIKRKCSVTTLAGLVALFFRNKLIK